MYMHICICVYIIKFAIIILHVQFSGIKYIESVLQPSPLFLKLFHYPKQKLCSHNS